MTLIEKSKDELEIDRAELAVLRQRFVQEKMAIQSLLADVNVRCKIRLPQGEYIRLQKQRCDLTKSMNEKESNISQLNSRLRELQAVIDFKRRNLVDIKKLIAIRDEWHDFSMDKKNDPVKRRVAWIFSQQLRELLKPYFDQDNSSSPAI
jgi:hypothetical protein